MLSLEKRIFLQRSVHKIYSLMRRVFNLRKRHQSAPGSEEMSVGDLVKNTWLHAEIERPLPNDRTLRRVEIIVLSYNSPEVEGECARRLIQRTNWPYKITFFDNRSGTKNMSKIWNKLIRESTCDYVLIMDSDIFVPRLSPCWLTRLIQTFDEKGDCFVVSPKVTRTSASMQQAWKPVAGPAVLFTEEFAGMCILYKKEVFDAVGYFDEEFLLYGSDSEWARRLLRSKYANAYVRSDVVVDHIAHYSTKKASETEKSSYDYAFERAYAGKLLEQKMPVP